ncbi:MAG: ABC transporter ATP-binding protein [Planctomycetia bacterium]|nr:ABC transporter ATP-binding protein [Planctomycetia bacterium]
MKESDIHSSAVELRGVTKRFGSRMVLDDINLSVARGEIVVIVGPSGCGKSTLLKIVSGIETADRGQVLLSGRDCTALPAYRRPVHTVFQNYALFPHLDVTANVAFPLNVAGVPRAAGERLVHEALGFALARALVDSPHCVLLDEPLSALDPHLRAETLELLQGIQKRLETTFLFITHDREEALRLGHRIGVLNGGRLEQVGPPQEMYDAPRTAFVASFLGKINWIVGECVHSGGSRVFVVEGQSVPGTSSNGIAAGKVQLGIRPEDVLIDTDGWLAAQVIARRFLGNCVVLELQLASGAVIISDCREPLPDALPGQHVRIRWAADAAHLFPANGTIST